jgi:hypothetical protein
MMMPNPKRTLWGHAFTHNAWCLGFPLLLLFKKLFALSLCPFAPFTTITLALSFFLGHFSSSLVMFMAHCHLSNSFLLLSCSLLLAPYYFAIAHVLMVLTTHLLCFTLSFNMVICLNWHLMCFVHLIMTLLLHNGFCLCCFSHSLVALTTYCFFWVIFLCLILLSKNS